MPRPDPLARRWSEARVAGPLLARALDRFGYAGIAMPWGRYYIVPELFDDEQIHVHERQHLEQMRRDGVAVFLVRYAWWLLRHGYVANPYEIEARQRTEYGVADAAVVTARRLRSASRA